MYQHLYPFSSSPNKTHSGLEGEIIRHFSVKGTDWSQMRGNINTYKFISISSLRKKGFLSRAGLDRIFQFKHCRLYPFAKEGSSFLRIRLTGIRINQSDFSESTCQAHWQGANRGRQSSEWGWWLVPRFQVSYLTNESYYSRIGSYAECKKKWKSWVHLRIFPTILVLDLKRISFT